MERVAIRPYGISFNPAKLRWPRTEHTEVVTRVPRKLYTLLRDALEGVGYTRISSKPLRVVGRTIAGTGTMKGSLLAENRPREVLLPWLALRITGWAMIIIGLVILLLEVWNYVSIGTMDYYLFLLAVVLALLGARLLGLHRFSSNIMWIDIQGEAFPSSLRDSAPEMPGTFPLVCDLRIRINATSAITRNATSKRKLVRMLDNAKLKRDFDHLFDIIARNVLPRVHVSGPVELREEELPPPPPDE